MKKVFTAILYVTGDTKYLNKYNINGDHTVENKDFQILERNNRSNIIVHLFKTFVDILNLDI